MNSRIIFFVTILSFSEGLGWWFSDVDYFKSTQVSDYVKGFDESLKEVEKVFEEKGPFDGILGFSQGGSMVGLICALKQLGGKFLFLFHFEVTKMHFSLRIQARFQIRRSHIFIQKSHIHSR